MNRILIVGISGTGKTHLAEQLAGVTKLPAANLDSIFWKENWQEENPQVVEAKIRKVVEKQKWIIEGYIEPLGRLRVERADEILFLDFPGYTALWGCVGRWLKHYGRARAEMPAGNVESFRFKFLMTILMRKERPEIEAAIKGYENKISRLKSRRAVSRYIAKSVA